MDVEELSDLLQRQLAKIKDWNVESFQFNVPMNDFMDDVIDLGIPETPVNECPFFCTNIDTISNQDLSKHQLATIRSSGIVTVSSRLYPGFRHVWKLSPVLQCGLQNLLENFVRDIIQSCRHWVLAQNYYYRDQTNSVWAGSKNMSIGIWEIIGLILGKTYQKKINSEDFIVQTLVKKMESGKIIFYNDDQGRPIHSSWTKTKFLEMTRNLLEPFEEFEKEWQQNKIARRKNLAYTEGFSIIGLKEMDIIWNKENIIHQKKILQLVYQYLPKEEADALANLMQAMFMLRVELAKFNSKNQKNQTMKEHQEFLAKKQPIYAKVPEWLCVQMRQCEKKFNSEKKINAHLSKIANIFHSTEKNIFRSHLEYGDKYKILTKNFEFDIKFFNDEKKITNSTSYLGWRVVNLFVRSVSYGTKTLTRFINMLETKQKNFHPETSISKSILEQLANQWKFSGGENRSVWIWLYFYGGALFKSPILLVKFLAVFGLNLLSNLVQLSLIPLSMSRALGIYFWSILIYDSDAPKESDHRHFPLAQILIKKILLAGIVPFAKSMTMGNYHLFMSVIKLLWAIIKIIGHYAYDTIMYGYLRCAKRIPWPDDFTNKINGPGSHTAYCYVIDHMTAVVLIYVTIQNMEMNAFIQESNHIINQPFDQLIEFYRSFQNLGIGFDKNSDYIKKFIATRSQLLERLEIIERHYWEKHRIRGLMRIRNKVHLSGSELNLAIKIGANLCQKLIPKKVFSRLNTDEVKYFFEKKKLEENDWYGLSVYCLKSMFGESVTIPYEENATMIALPLSNPTIDKMIKKLRSYLENEKIVDIPKSEIYMDNPDLPVVTPNNLFTDCPIESMFFLDENVLSKYFQ